MIKKLKRAQTVANDRKIRIKRKSRRNHGCKHEKSDTNKHQEHSCWSHSICQVAPTAAIGQKELCRDHTGSHAPANSQYGTTDTYGRLLSRAHAYFESATGRRWSSVEVGTHHISLKSTLPDRPLTPQLSPNPVVVDSFESKIANPRYRSSTLTGGAKDVDLVATVRKTLTFRRVSPEPLSVPVEAPLSITLRRASGASAYSNVREINYQSSGGNSGATTPELMDNVAPRQPSIAYLITSEDIDTITDLIAANLVRKHNSHSPENGILDKPSSSGERSAAQDNNASRNRSNSIKRRLSFIAGSKTKVSNDIAKNAGSHRPEYLQVAPPTKKRAKRTSTHQSVHEVLWEGEPPSDSPDTGEEPVKKVPYHETASQQDESYGPKGTKPAKDKGDAFDPQNAHASINDWSWKLPQNDIKMVVTDSDSESTDATPKASSQQSDPPQHLHQQHQHGSAVSLHKERVSTRTRPFLRYASSHEGLQDVVSFPPLLPRKTTSEWFSPLPAMETASPLATPPLEASRNLYDFGLDITGTMTPRAKTKSWVRSIEASPAASPGIEFRHDYEFGRVSLEHHADLAHRRKSVVKPHPKAAARTGQPFAMGSSIGSFASERRRSSGPRIQRVRTIDNVHKGERDAPIASRWRKPSIAPARKTSSPAPPDICEDDSHVPEVVTRLGRLRSGTTDRVTLLEASVPPLPQPDRVGIYGKITGTLRRTIANVGTGEGKGGHECDDCETDPRTPSVDWIG